MSGIFPDIFGAGAGDGLLPFGEARWAPNVIDGNRNAILGYLAGALQGGNLGQSIGRGLQGWTGGAQRDTAEQGQRAALQYVGEQQDMDPALKSALMQNPALAMQYLHMPCQTARDERHGGLRICQEAGLWRHAGRLHSKQALWQAGTAAVSAAD